MIFGELDWRRIISFFYLQKFALLQREGLKLFYDIKLDLNLYLTFKILTPI